MSTVYETVNCFPFVRRHRPSLVCLFLDVSLQLIDTLQKLPVHLVLGLQLSYQALQPLDKCIGRIRPTSYTIVCFKSRISEIHAFISCNFE